MQKGAGKHKCDPTTSKEVNMKNMFMSKAELNEALPWSKNIVTKMIQAGIFKPVKNPLATGRSKMFFWRPQVEETIAGLVGDDSEKTENCGTRKSAVTSSAM